MRILKTDYVSGGVVDFSFIREIENYSENELITMIRFYKLAPTTNLQAWRMVRSLEFRLLQKYNVHIDY
jgi:hypothetical protein